MTIQYAGPAAIAKSKRTLQDALNADPASVRFYDPSLFTNRPHFTGADYPSGAPVVLDPVTRRRFAIIHRTPKGFRVE